MKLQEVPTEILTESLLALADLRRKYKGEPMVTAYAATDPSSIGWEGCPLCLFAKSNPLGECDGCPWMWCEGMDCGVSQGDYRSRPIPDRLARIDRWETAITEELAARSKANG